jgi:hypothetical protein
VPIKKQALVLTHQRLHYRKRNAWFSFWKGVHTPSRPDNILLLFNNSMPDNKKPHRLAGLIKIMDEIFILLEVEVR